MCARKDQALTNIRIIAHRQALAADADGVAAILKVADLEGVMGVGAGFRSANHSVASRASPALW